MGCMWGKPSPAIGDSPRQRELNRKTSELLVARAVSRKNHEIFSAEPKLENNGDMRIGPKYTKSKTVSMTVRDDYHDIKRVKDSDEICNFPSMGSLPKAVEGEQVAAGWPSWLVTVAGEAIRGWVPRKAETFEKLDKIGQGTYSSVYKGRDLVHNKTVALKKVRFDTMDPESIKFMAREILILRKLDHPNIIKLQGLVTSTTSCSLYLVFEYMEHDLTGLASLPGVKFKEPQVKCYMRQLLSGLDHCHRNGILHRDIKGSNLLIDNYGILKIADFGLASHFDDNQKVPLTSRVVTLWYRPPELLLGATQYGVGVDLWSAGCILGELYAGKPIMPGRTEVEQLHKIFKLCGSPSEDCWRRSKLPHSPVFKSIQPYRPCIEETFKNLPEPSVRLMKTLLSIDPSERGTASSALHSEFFDTEPLACDPSSLPSYPPSKEIDAKRREEEARRQGAPRVKGHKCEYDNKRSKESRCSAAPITNAGLGRSIQSRHSNVNSKCHTDLFSPEPDGAAPCPDPWRSHHERVSSSGPHARRPGGALPGRKNTNPSLNETGSRALSTVTPIEKIGSSCVGPTDPAGRFSESFGDPLRKRGGRRPPPALHGPQDEEPDTISEQCGPGSMHFSGPLPSNNIDRVPKDSDHLIKEAVRRIKQQQKAKVGGLWPR